MVSGPSSASSSYHHHWAPSLEAVATALHRSCASVRASVANMSVSLQTWRSHECRFHAVADCVRLWNFLNDLQNPSHHTHRHRLHRGSGKIPRYTWDNWGKRITLLRNYFAQASYVHDYQFITSLYTKIVKLLMPEAFLHCQKFTKMRQQQGSTADPAAALGELTTLL